MSKPQKKRGKEVEKIEEDLKKVGRKVKNEAAKVEDEVTKEAEGLIQGSAKPLSSRPTGRVPEAMVVARHGTDMVTRSGRGFSPGELSGVGLAPSQAAKWGVRIDQRRRSVLDGNVSSLKAWGAHVGVGARLEGETRMMGEKIEKAVREVEKEAHEVEKEAFVLEKKVRKGAKKAKTAVKKKVEKPKARPKKKKP